jgi:hypothetical protein
LSTIFASSFFKSKDLLMPDVYSCHVLHNFNMELPTYSVTNLLDLFCDAETCICQNNVVSVFTIRYFECQNIRKSDRKYRQRWCCRNNLLVMLLKLSLKWCLEVKKNCDNEWLYSRNIFNQRNVLRKGHFSCLTNVNWRLFLTLKTFTRKLFSKTL